ncbi:dolichyl-phosphate-mannose-protein mannosyltransferase [Sphingomonas sp. Leaf33]|uniref:phospholipid carrier-dependent glycosyltransferase n=1 Tax=Sphingomonas sp. Leaf33 TaxID=1736215 RepID=UPI0006F293FC|nr:phospholipid carrier-dependent glycosyltransferase [Sphingomonas sp. Leaf33]KQN19397.1 dolichyl-phosphate-mannose-protein mannosyltransferase [Sphingomonas sp. Leaf33]
MHAIAIRPAVAALLIALAAQLLFSVGVTRPSKLVFDEVHYVPAARALAARERPTNTEHPLLGKTIIAAGMGLFGDTPLGWRAMSTLAGTATVLGVFWVLFLLFGSVATASYGALFAAVNMTLFVHARIAMLEPFLGAFVTLGIAALLWAMRAPPRWIAARWLLGAVLLGLATGVKWTAAPYIAFAGLAFLAVRARDGTAWSGLGRITALAILGGASALTYLATFWPAFQYRDGAMTLARLIPFQRAMYAQQTQVLRPHPYQSSWFSWPFAARPIWYLYEPVDGAIRGILYLGNPAIMWGGLVTVAWLAVYGLRHRRRAATGVALLWMGSIAIWAVIPKSLGFYYYYHLSGIFLCIALAAAFHLADRPRSRWWFAVIAIALFVYFHPIIAATALPSEQAFARWTWFDSWR